MKRILSLLILCLGLLVAGPVWAGVNVNSASQSELETLPGIGPSKASAIIEYRNANGPFANLVLAVVVLLTALLGTRGMVAAASRALDRPDFLTSTVFGPVAALVAVLVVGWMVAEIRRQKRSG